MKKLLILLLLFTTPVSAAVVAPNGAKEIENYVTSWIGNTYGGLNPQTGKAQWVQQDIAGMCVTPDGTVYTNVPWEEAGGNCSMYKDGEMLGAAMHTHGWGALGGKAVAVNDKYVYIAMEFHNEGGNLVDPGTWPDKGKRWFGVSRRLRSDFTQPAPFEDGKGGKGDTLEKSFLVVNEVPDGQNADVQTAITGLWADNERLYVSNPHTNSVEIHDAETMRKLETWALAEWKYHAPGQIAADPHGNIWIAHLEKQIRRDTPISSNFPTRVYEIDIPQITQFSKTGEKLAGKVMSTGPFCFGPPKTRFEPRELMYVFDPNFGIILLPLDFSGNPAGDSELRTDWSYKDLPVRRLLGMTNPMNAMSPFFYPPGEFGDFRFDCFGVKALGCDKHGRLYVAQDISTSGGGTILECHIVEKTSRTADHPRWKEQESFLRFADTRLLWRRFGLCFLDCACLDPDDETIAYTKDEKYRLDWSKGSGQEWSLVGTVYPDKWSAQQKWLGDSGGVWVRNIGGKKTLFLLDMNNRYLRYQSLDFGDNSEILACFERHEYREVANKEEAGRGVGRRFFSHLCEKEGEGWYSMKELMNEEEEIKRLLDCLSEAKKTKSDPPAQGWWVDLNGGVWFAAETDGVRYAPCEIRKSESMIGDFDYIYYHPFQTFPHPAEFTAVKRIRYDAATDTLYLGGCTQEHKNQHWKPMGPVVCRYDHFLHGNGKLAWKIVLPYVTGSSGHESCEPMGFDVAGDYLFVPYTGASKETGFKTGHVEVYRISDGQSVGWMEPDPKTVGEVGLMDLRECISAHRRQNGEYVIFLEDDYKAKVIMYRWKGRLNKK